MDVARLNINVGGRPSPGFSGDTRDFLEIETLVGGAVPASYVELMRLADGGHPEIGSCHPKDATWGRGLFDLDCFYAVVNPDVENVRDAYARWGKVLGKGALPLGQDGGGNQVYIALSGGAAPVWLHIHDEDGQRFKLSDSLEEIIDSLIPNPDFI